MIALLLFRSGFLKFFFSVAMARIKTMLNNSDECRHPCLVSDLKRKYFVLTTENNICCRPVIHGLYYIEAGSSYATYWRLLNRCGKLSKSFVCIYRDYCIFLILQLVNTVYHMDHFA